MKRREFIKSSVAAASVAGLTSAFNAATAEAKEPGAREYYELRLYHLRRGPKTKMLDDYMRTAAIPALNRAGITPVGAFNLMIGPDSPTLYLLLPFKSMEAFATLPDKLKADADYAKASAEFSNLPATDPLYIRMESSLMIAFEGMPKVEVPAEAAEKKPRIFELRTYESHNKKANKKKIEMFNTGEIAIFRRNGLQPVFFGETLIGTKLPNLTYLLTFPDMATHDANWGKFGADPEWKKLSTTPGYTDPEIVTNITNVFLRPTAYSQI